MRANQRAEQEVAQAKSAAAELRESVTLGAVWSEYVTERTPYWGIHQIAAHKKAIQNGGEKRKRSAKLTKPGPLAPLADMRLVDLTSGCIEAWAQREAKTRPSSGRLALRLLKACLNRITRDRSLLPWRD